MRYGNVVGCNLSKYFLSPVISRSFPTKDVFLSFLQLLNLARSGFSTICSAYIPYSPFLREAFTICLLRIFFPLRSEAGPSPGGLGVGVGASLQVVPISHKTISFRGGVFAAKFLCGTIAPGGTPQVPPPGFPLVPGTYLTAINIYNPHTFQVRV